MQTPLFDTWTEKYDRWFETPTGKYVMNYESSLLLDLLVPQPGECILDAGCGTGLFTKDVIRRGARVAGMDLSGPMVAKGIHRLHEGEDSRFSGICGDMCELPFSDNCFDKSFSMTAIEFIADAGRAIEELNRVTKQGGTIVVTTLNSLSPWAKKRRKKGEAGHSLFKNIFFRSPADMRVLIPEKCIIKTAIHFQKDDVVEQIPQLEERGRKGRLETGAFLAAQWIKK